MTTETKQEPTKVSDMIRTTDENQANFLAQIANHIDKLEDSIVQLTNRISNLESKKINGRQKTINSLLNKSLHKGIFLDGQLVARYGQATRLHAKSLVHRPLDVCSE